MTNRNFTTTFTVDQTPETVFAAINNVPGWWSKKIKGRTDKLDEKFDYHFKDIHRCRIKIMDLIPPANKIRYLTQWKCSEAL